MKSNDDLFLAHGGELSTPIGEVLSAVAIRSPMEEEDPAAGEIELRDEVRLSFGRRINRRRSPSLPDMRIASPPWSSCL